MSEPVPLEPCVEPQYRPQAAIVNGDMLFNAIGTTYRDLSKAARHHVNTVSDKFKGSHGQYLVVHDCFTAVNVLSGGGFSRSAHVHYVDNQQTFEDRALDRCYVFPNLGQHLATLKKDARAIGNDCAVQTRYVKDILAGRPVAENLVEAVFASLLTHIPTLVKSDELFR